MDKELIGSSRFVNLVSD